MTTATMPGFTAEISLRRMGANYRMTGTHSVPRAAGVVLPQVQVCSDCSDWLRGTRYCCDVTITCNPYGGCTTFQLCHTQDCGVLVVAERIF